MNGWKKRIPEKNLIWSRRIPERRLRGDGEEPLPDYLEGLNAEQKEAVLSTEGPLLVLAGAGTGKTRVLTTRLAHLLQTHKAYPSQILAVTFTNKAAREMRERIESMLDGPADGLWLGTFHSICARMLRQNCEYVNLERNFTILDTDDQIRLLKQLMAGAGVDKNHFPPKQVLHQIQKWKDRGLDPFDVKSGEGGSVPNRQWVHLYELYQKRLIELNACDFGDLMLHMVKIFCRHPEILGRYQNRFRYIMVDEYQDTNAIQYRWLRQLAAGNARPNLACVGDDDQSIYSWRGAEVENILRFQKDFPGTHLVRLEKNYRSTPAILGAASGVIAHNDSRLGKTLYASDPDLQGELVQLARIYDSEEEAGCVAREIFLQNQRGAIPFRNMAVLVRAGFQMRAFETAFTEAQIPYRIVGGPKFYERTEIRDALAYMRAFSSDRDDLALERIINLPRRGMGTAGLVKLRNRANQSGLSLQQQLREDLRERRLKGKAGSALKKLVESFDAALERMESMEHVQAVEMLLKETGYQQMWREDTSTEASGRLENLQELLHYLASFEDLSSFLEHIALVMDSDSGNAQADSVNLMTIHAAKGLEFNSVFLPGWEEGVFPSWRSLDAGNAGLEEERRLAYVAITRARKKIMILQATRRCINGNWQDSIPSRFIEEIPDAFIDRPEEPAGRRTLPSFSRTPPFSRKRPDVDAGRRPGIKVGAQVSHSRFGVGVIVEMEGNRLRIKFEDGQERHLLSDYVTVSN